RLISGSPRDALEGEGPIVNRARSALKNTAAQFGTVTSFDRKTVTVLTARRLTLAFSYTSGNYLFSRVYHLIISVGLPPQTRVPTEIELSFNGKGAPEFHPKRKTRSLRPTAGPRLNALNAQISAQLREIDLIQSEVTGRTLNVVPLGGSFVWVLIPPVF